MAKSWLGLAAVIAAALLAGSSLLTPGFYDSHDGLLNVHRLFEFEKCVEDGQIPCRWVPDMGAGYGYPLFNFYPPLPTWIAAGFRGLGASFTDAVKWAFLLALVVGAIGMFRLASRFFGAAGGTLAAVLYTFAPYQAIDVFVRGALGEAWGMALLPWLFLAGYRSGLACVFASAALLLSHDIVALMAAPIYSLWLILAWRGSNQPMHWLRTSIAAHALGLALAAFFVLPLLFELQHVHADTLVSLYPWARYENNFLGAGQLLFSPKPWGYGAMGTPNAMSPFVGSLHALLGLGAVCAGALLAARDRKLDVATRAAMFFGCVGAAAIWMVLPGSRPLWDLLPPLAFLQFPWRFLVVVALGLSFAAGWIAFALRRRETIAWSFVVVASLGVIGMSWQTFRPAAMHRITPEALANEREIAKARHGLYDFLPRAVDLDHFIANPPPPRPAPVTAPADVVVSDARRSSNEIRFEASVRDESAVVQLGVFDFPGWSLTVDGEPMPFAETDDPIGRLHVRLAPGAHSVVARFENTPVRSFGNALSVIALLAALGWTAAVIRSR